MNPMSNLVSPAEFWKKVKFLHCCSLKHMYWHPLADSISEFESMSKTLSMVNGHTTPSDRQEDKEDETGELLESSVSSNSRQLDMDKKTQKTKTIFTLIFILITFLNFADFNFHWRLLFIFFLLFNIGLG